MENTTVLDAAKELISRMDNADKILLGAGAGLSAAAGLSYMDREAFKKYYPDMAALGYHFPYELVGRRDDEWTPGRKWAYWATHINYVRNIFPSAPLYHTLLHILEGRDYFVVTSNADRQFMRAGFPMDRLFEFQGNYDNMGCSAGCTRMTWDNHDYIQKIIENIDHTTFECKPDALPRCPYCGELAEICFRSHDYKELSAKYVQFVESCVDKNTCIIEIGVGFNTPGVIRWPFEQLAYQIPGAYLTRVTNDYKDYPYPTAHPEYPKALEGKITVLNMDAKDLIETMASL